MTIRDAIGKLLARIEDAGISYVNQDNLGYAHMFQNNLDTLSSNLDMVVRDIEHLQDLIEIQKRNEYASNKGN